MIIKVKNNFAVDLENIIAIHFGINSLTLYVYLKDSKSTVIIESCNQEIFDNLYDKWVEYKDGKEKKL